MSRFSGRPPSPRPVCRKRLASRESVIEHDDEVVLPFVQLGGDYQLRRRLVSLLLRRLPIPSGEQHAELKALLFQPAKFPEQRLASSLVLFGHARESIERGQDLVGLLCRHVQDEYRDLLVWGYLRSQVPVDQHKPGFGLSCSCRLRNRLRPVPSSSPRAGPGDDGASSSYSGQGLCPSLDKAPDAVAYLTHVYSPLRLSRLRARPAIRCR